MNQITNYTFLKWPPIYHLLLSISIVCSRFQMAKITQLQKKNLKKDLGIKQPNNCAMKHKC